MRTSTWLLAFALVALIGIGGWALAEQPSGASYMGRPIARTMSYHGAPWLTRPERDREERPAELYEAMQLSPEHTVCDVGAGNGYHAIGLAPRVRQVLANDLQPEMLRLLEQRARQAGVDNVRTVLGTADDPKLPAGACDKLLLVDVYHELSDPEAMLARLRTALAPGGEAVLVEFRAEDPTVPIKPLHKMSKEQAVAEWTANGFRLVRSDDRLPWQHVLVFAADR